MILIKYKIINIDEYHFSYLQAYTPSPYIEIENLEKHSASEQSILNLNEP